MRLLPGLLLLGLALGLSAAGPLPCGARGAPPPPDCVSSLKDPQSPHWSRACPLKQHLEHKTALVADCRCFQNCAPRDGIDVCKRPQDLARAGVHVGAGPSLAGAHDAHYSGGFVDAEAGELVVAAYWGGGSARRGLVLAVDLATGDRRVVSGRWLDEAGTERGRGEGADFQYLVDVQRGPDGALYAWSDPADPSSHEILRVDPKSGARTLVWKSRAPAFGQLRAGDGKTMVQTHDHGFGLDADGGFFVGVSNPQTGHGVMKVSADGKTCRPVALSSKDAALARGAGPELRGFVQGYTLHGGKLHAFTQQPHQLLEIDPATGDRKVLLKGNASGAMGSRWAAWDSTHALWWTAGAMNTVTLVGFDPATRKVLNVFKTCGDAAFPWFPLCATGPAQINSLNYGGIWKHPSQDRVLMAQDSVGIVELELATGNSRVLSL